MAVELNDKTLEQYIATARETESEIPVSNFRVDITASELLKLIKKLDIVVQDKVTDRIPLTILGGR